MKSIQSAYSELLHLTELYLLREHSLKEVRHVDPALLDYFKGRPLRKLVPSPPKLETKVPPISNPEQQPLLHPLPPQPSLVEKSGEGDDAAAPPDQAPPPVVLPIVEQAQKETTPLSIAQTIEKEAASQTKQTKPPAPATQPPPINKERKEKRFLLDPFPPATELDQTQWWKLSRELFNSWPLQESIPSDALAKKNSQAWLQSKETAPITLLSFNDNPQQLHLLKNIAQAISLRLAPAQVVSAPQIEKENGWEALLHSPELRLVIASDYGLYLHPKLMEFHREQTQQHKHFLHNTPFLLLSDLSLYLKQPKLKPLLWRAICNEFSALPPTASLNKES